MDDYKDFFGLGDDGKTENTETGFNNTVREPQNPQQPTQQPTQAPEYYHQNTGFPYGNYQTNNYQQPQTQQGNTGYYIPNVPNPAQQTKKKKNKTTVVIVIIAIICAIVAFAGLSMAGKDGSSSKSKSENTTSSQSSDSNKDEDDVTAKSSAEAEKKDKNGNLTAAGVAEKSKASCVGITVYTDQASDYFGNYGQSQDSNGQQASGEGSGVIMKESNGKTYIMTCAHVVEGGSSFKVTLDNDKEYDARLVGADGQTDIGVLVVEATGLSVAEFGDSKDIEVGEECVAIGCPGGLQFKNSVTKGIVSALAAPVSSSIGYTNECIQVDAAINPGNSGGALFNMQGQVIGINSSKIASTEYEGMGFAVPSNTALETANSIIKNGYVAGRAMLGIQYNALDNYQSASAILSALNDKGFKDANGAMVIRAIDSGSDLANKDVKEYDMIVAVDGKTMTSTDVMTSLLSKKKPGDTVKLTIARINGNSIKTFEVNCKLIESKQ